MNLRKSVSDILRSTAALSAGLLLTLAASTVAAQVPVSLMQQGRMLDDSGEPVTGAEKMTFKIYDAKTGGNVIWKETRSVELDDNGFYSTQIGSKGSPVTPSVFSEADRWLGISVGDSPELTPRVKIRSVPYASVAGHAHSVANGAVEEASLSPRLQSRVRDPSPTWKDVENKPSGLTDGDDDTLGGLSCMTGHVAKFDGSSWRCEKAYTDADAVKAVQSADEFVEKVGDTMSGKLDMGGNRVTNLGSPTDKVDAATKQYVDQQIAKATSPENMFWWAAVSLDNVNTRTPTYEDQNGNTETLSLPSSGSLSCSSNRSVCVYNHGGSHYDISFDLPSSVNDSRNAPEFGNLMCWALAPGDNEGLRSYGNEIDAYAADINGGHRHCVPGASTGSGSCLAIRTTGTDTSSHTTYGVVCIK